MSILGTFLISQTLSTIVAFAQKAKGGLDYGIGSGNTEFSGFQDYVNVIMPKIIPIGVALAVMMLIYAGIQYVTSQGDPNKIGTSKNIIVSTIIGLVMLLMASYILDILLQRS